MQIKSKKDLYEFLNNKQTHVTVLLTYMYSKYDTEFIEWDQITFSQIMKEEFGSYPSQTLMDKFGAGTALFANDLFFTTLNVFNTICSTFSLEATVTEVFLPADLDAVLWGCTEAKLLLGDIYIDSVFSDDIKSYCGLLLADEGIYNPPAILGFAEYPEGTGTNITDNLSTDPIFAALKYEKDEQVKDDIVDLLNKRLLTLLHQIDQLPIEIDREFVATMVERMKNVINLEDGG
jgi:hypothetical protein